MDASNALNIHLYTKLYQIDMASILKHIALTSQNNIDNVANGFVHGKYIISPEIKWTPLYIS